MLTFMFGEGNISLNIHRHEETDPGSGPVIARATLLRRGCEHRESNSRAKRHFT